MISFSCEDLFLEEEPGNSPISNFEIFWNDLDRYYSFFELKGIDWDSVYTASITELNSNPTNFQLLQVFDGIVQYLQDGHTDIYAGIELSYNFINRVNGPQNRGGYASLFKASDVINYGLVNSDPEIGYMTVDKFAGDEPDYLVIDEVLEEFRETKAIIIDVRNNGGGSERNAATIAGRFIDAEKVYARIRYRGGPGRNDFTEWADSRVSPAGNFMYNGQVIILTNRVCFSSTEAFLLMMKTSPNVIQVGDTTGGGSGNPIFRELPNGWSYRFSSWQQVDPNGRQHEGAGILPDVPVWISEEDSIAGRDTIIETAISLINN